jgi:hypothetical protein
MFTGNIPSWPANQVGGNYVLDHQLMLLSVLLADEIMTSSRIKQDDSWMPIQRK